MNKTNELDSEETDEILNTVKEFFRAFDAKEWDKCRALLMDEVRISFFMPSGEKSGLYSADDLINKWKQNLFKKKKSYRQRSKPTVEIKDGIVSVSSKNYIFHRLEESKKQEFWEIWGDYTHYLVKTEEGWKCSGYRLIISAHSPNFDVNKFLPEN